MQHNYRQLMPVDIIEIPANSPREAEMLQLRHRVLREPLGLKFTAEQLAADADNIRLAALIGGEMVGCILLAPLNDTTVKFRQMAVDPDYRGRRIGQELLQHAESLARSKNFREAELHARESAVGFYQRLGYECTGESFTEVTIPHRKMVKHLAE